MPDRQTKATLDAIDRFNDVFNRHNVDQVMALMTEDCVFENTLPPPDGERFEGATAVRGFWERFFRSTPNARFEAEEVFAAGDRAWCGGCSTGTTRVGTSAAWTWSGCAAVGWPRNSPT